MLFKPNGSPPPPPPPIKAVMTFRIQFLKDFFLTIVKTYEM